MLLLALVGCTSSDEKKLQGSVEDVTWPALQNMTDDTILRPIVMPVSMDTPGPAKTHLSTDTKFKEALDAFEKEPIPGKFSTPAREEARKDAIKHYRAAIEGAKSGIPDAEFSEHVKAATKSMGVLTARPPQQVEAPKK
jgi:hypothetical protein